MRKPATLLLVYTILSFFTFVEAAEASLERALESKRQTMQSLSRRARTITDNASREIGSLSEWESVRAKRLEETRDMLGLLPWPARNPLNARVTGTLDQGAYTIEKLAFESLPKVYVTGNLYLPKKRTGKAPAIVYVCGHSYSPYGDKTKYQRHGISFAKNGYVALILDSIQIAETFALHHGVSHQDMFDWYARGYTPAGAEVWNAMRAIDYLEGRPEVDPQKIGMTGRSGGAAMTWFTAAVDPRVKAAVPVMGISTYAANVAANTQRLHCDCMFLINSYRHDMLHQGALIAPRPLLMAHGRQDDLFPVAGYEEFEAKVGALYRALNCPERFRNIVVDTGHRDSDYLREQAIRWFDRHLLGIQERALDLSYVDAGEASLAVFPEGPPRDALNFRVHEIFLPTPQLRSYSTLGDWEPRRQKLIQLLKRKVFADFPERLPTATLRLIEQPQSGFREATFHSEPEVEIRALLSRPTDNAGRIPALLYIASDGEDVTALRDTLRPRRGERAVCLVVHPRGVGAIPWEKSFWKSTLRNAMHVGHTVDSLRLWDVLHAVEILRADPTVDPARITVMGNGVSGLLGLYAAILNKDINQVVLMNPTVTHLNGPIFLDVLRYLDLPEAAALLAPRRLVFYGSMPSAFEPARQIYSLYGKPAHLNITMDFWATVHERHDHDFASEL